MVDDVAVQFRWPYDDIGDTRRQNESKAPYHDDWYSRELAEYANSAPTRNHLKGVLLFVALNLLIVAKCAYHIMLTWLEIDYKHFEHNIKPIALDNRQQAFKFLCVLTNCTRLSTDGRSEEPNPLAPFKSHHTTADEESLVIRLLAVDLKHLPIFTLCHSNLLYLYSPMAELGQLGILTSSYVSLLIICTSLGFTVQQIFNKANAESLMFIVAPHVTLQLLCIQVEKMHREYTSSLENFRALAPRKVGGGRSQMNSRTTIAHYQPLVRSADARRRPNWFTSGDELYHKLHQYRRIFEEHQVWSKQTHQLSEPNHVGKRGFVSDCLPAVRTGWWHKRIAYLYFNSFIWFMWIFCVPTAVLSFSVMTYTIHNMQIRLEAYDKFMEATGCAIWRDSEPGAPIKLAELSVGWSLWDIIGTGLPVICTVSITIILSTLIFAIISELNCWLKEIQQNLQLFLQLVHLQYSCAFLQELSDARHRHTMQPQKLVSAGTVESGMSMMRDLFTRHTHIRWFSIRTKPLGGDFSGKLVDLTKGIDIQVKLVQQEFALAMLQRANSKRLLLVELAQKIYLNYRLFVRMIDMYSTNIAASILLEHIAAYGSTLMAVFLNRITSDMSQYTRTLIVIILTCVFTFITIISNFHAEARKLQPLFWSLIAELAHTSDIDLLHLRHVLTKQTVHVDREGGLAMRAFNLRVTYTNVIRSDRVDLDDIGARIQVAFAFTVPLGLKEEISA